MMESLPQGTLSTPQAQALAKIIAVTRSEWGVAQAAPAPTQPASPGAGNPAGRQRRRDQFAQRAARAFEAQVMALRCRQAFVA